MAAKNAQILTRLGMMTALAIILHAVEAMLPIPYVIPGAKLGLANMVALYLLMTYGFKASLTVNILRSLLAALFLGTFMTIPFYLSFSGAIVSTLTMGLTLFIFRERVSLIGVSIVGALFHNITQIIVVSQIINTLGVFIYLPYLFFFAIPTGFFIGLTAFYFGKHLRRS